MWSLFLWFYPSLFLEPKIRPSLSLHGKWTMYPLFQPLTLLNLVRSSRPYHWYLRIWQLVWLLCGIGDFDSYSRNHNSRPTVRSIWESKIILCRSCKTAARHKGTVSSPLSHVLALCLCVSLSWSSLKVSAILVQLMQVLMKWTIYSHIHSFSLYSFNSSVKGEN